MTKTKRSGALFHVFMYGGCQLKFSTALNPKKTAIQFFYSDRGVATLAARGLEEPRNSQELLTKSVGPVHFS